MSKLIRQVGRFAHRGIEWGAGAGWTGVLNERWYKPEFHFRANVHLKPVILYGGQSLKKKRLSDFSRDSLVCFEYCYFFILKRVYGYPRTPLATPLLMFEETLHAYFKYKSAIKRKRFVGESREQFSPTFCQHVCQG